MTKDQAINEATVSAREIIRRALNRTGARSNAIKAMCLQCTGFDRGLIRDCVDEGCALHAWRPFASRDTETEQKSALEGAEAA